ncbi:hypothetical protein TNCV_4672961 [Trichonephila clavipes]|nr:hypothetical protein TNCV_4672961 [Trichonephila clavipes]
MGATQAKATVQQQRKSCEINVLCAVSRKTILSPFFKEKTVTEAVSLDVLTLWSMHGIANFILLLDGAPPHWLTYVRYYLCTFHSSMDWMSRGLRHVILLMGLPKSLLYSL